MVTRRYAKGQERREQILDAAYEVLSREGYAKTSLGEIGRMLGMSSANIVYYFDTREDLLIEVLRRWDAHSSVLAASGEADDRDPLGRWLRAVEENSRHRGIVQLYTAFAAEASAETHPAHEYFTTRYVAVQTAIAAELERFSLTSGRVIPDVDEIAAFLISLSDGLQIRWLLDPSVDMVGALRHAVARVLDTVPTRDAPL